MRLKRILLVFLFCAGTNAYAVEYHVSPKGDDTNCGTESSPFKTIGKAAAVAYPGDIITVHAGTYREWINPPRGGKSDSQRIVYRAAPGEKAVIKGSERITSWKPVEGHKGVWKVVLPDSFFKDYNPYTDKIYGDWFGPKKRIHHTGEVFLNEKSLYEKETLEKVYHPEPMTWILDPEGSTYTWYCEHKNGETTIWANFHKTDPNKELTEINVRKTCFYPLKKGINYLTIDGFHISQAATQWAPPTAEQIGMVATHWNKGWIIENNVISNSKCSGITLGKERNSGQNVWLGDLSLDGSIHYIETTFRAIREGWNKENIGSHTVRNNIIFDCEQTGICGSMGAAWSVIENNHIYNIWTKRQFTGAEIGGIKFHAAIDTRIEGNRIHRCAKGIWLDWMTQGTRVSRNLLYDNDQEDLFVEVSHGPFLIDNNIMCSPRSFLSQSDGGAFVHNLLCGYITNFIEKGRYTPYFFPHSTDVLGLSIFLGGDMRFFNNIFAPAVSENKNPDRQKFGLAGYDVTAYPMMVDRNIYYGLAVPFAKEKTNLRDSSFQACPQLLEKGNKVYLHINIKGLETLDTEPVSTASLGKAKFTRQQFENPDGSPISFSLDYSGIPRNVKPVCGPLESLKEGKNNIRVW